MNDIYHLFLANTSVNGTEWYFYEWTRSNEIEQEWMIITVHERERTILKYMNESELDWIMHILIFNTDK